MRRRLRGPARPRLPRASRAPDELLHRARRISRPRGERGGAQGEGRQGPVHGQGGRSGPSGRLGARAGAERSKRDIPTIARKNRVIANIARALEERDSFLIFGHKDPDEDCVSSMVAFALLAGKLNKKSAIVLGPFDAGQLRLPPQHLPLQFHRAMIRSEDDLKTALRESSTLVLVDTPKPQMIDRAELYEAARKDASVLKIELDHHLEADSVYFGDPDYRLVYEASSTCEIIGRLAIKMENDSALKERYQIDEILSRNLVLAILSGMIGDSQMGRFLKSRRERWFYARFSSMFERMLARKTRSGSGNFSSKEQVFEALAALSDDEDACFRFMSQTIEQIGPVSFAVLDAEASR